MVYISDGRTFHINRAFFPGYFAFKNENVKVNTILFCMLVLEYHLLLENEWNALDGINKNVCKNKNKYKLSFLNNKNKSYLLMKNQQTINKKKTTISYTLLLVKKWTYNHFIELQSIISKSFWIKRQFCWPLRYSIKFNLPMDFYKCNLLTLL